MRLAEVSAEMRSLLDAPSPATLTLYGSDGQAITSPVWFRVSGDSFEFVIAATDKKLEHLRRDLRCILMVFETVAPFRGVMVKATATVTPDEDSSTRRAIASRYLGAEGGRRYADLARRPTGVVVSLPISDAKAWDLRASLPDAQESAPT